jgi:hypothetical protein
MIFRGVLRPLTGLVVLAFFFSGACGGSRRDATPDPKTANEPLASSGAPATSAPSAVESSPVATPASSSSPLDALPPPDTDTGGKSRQTLTMTDSRGTVDPSSNAIPSLPAKLDTPPQAGVDAAIKAVPSTIPIGNMSKGVLEAPLRDRARFEHCRIPYGTHGEIAAVVYNGAALGVDVKTKPNDRALNFCIERTVRQMTWLKELAVNKVKVSF